MTTAEEADALEEANEVAVVGFFKSLDSDKAKAFLAVASEMDDLAFAITTEDAVFKKYEITDDSVILLKKVGLLRILSENQVIVLQTQENKGLLMKFYFF